VPWKTCMKRVNQLVQGDCLLTNRQSANGAPCRTDYRALQRRCKMQLLLTFLMRKLPNTTHHPKMSSNSSCNASPRYPVNLWSAPYASLQSLHTPTHETSSLSDASLLQKCSCNETAISASLSCLQTLFHKARFRQDPFEWVYEGLSPLDMVDVLISGKGISLTLATTFAGVARELGIPMSLLPILEGTPIANWQSILMT